MASNSKPKEEDSDSSDSDDECLSNLKRKLANSQEYENSRRDIEEESDDERLLPGVFVSVELKEEDEAPPLSFTKVKKSKNTTVSAPKKPNRRYKSKQRKLFPCPSCDKVFTKARGLTTHSIVHQSNKMVPCPGCDEVFNKITDMKAHFLAHHNIQSRHKCEHCERLFTKAFSLKMHIKKVHKKQEEKCPVCDLAFTVRANLSRHLITHDRTEECEMCPAKFHTRQQLENHSKVHLRIPLPPPMKEPTNLKLQAIAKETENIQFIQDPDPDSADIKTEICTFLKQDDLTFPTKCAIVSKMHKGRSIAEVCQLYNLTPEVVNEIWEDREKYILTKKNGKKNTKYLNSVLDTRLIEWLNNQRASDIQVSGKMLQDMAEAFAKDCGLISFNGSRKWLDRFKKRYNITLRGTPKRDYNNISAESKWKQIFFKENWCDVRYGVQDEDIYTADEVGLYYNPSKGRIKKLASKKFIQGYVKDRLSIFLCTNVTGSDKRKLLVCGVEDPLIHSYRDPDTLPVKYVRHPQAHFTTQMFEDYVKTWNKLLQVVNKKAVLILDRATIHSKLQLSHLKLVFVPWKASNGLMPIKNGIFLRFRDEFRKLILEEKAMNALRGVDRNLTCLEGLNMLHKAWERTPADIINKAFVDIGYDVKRLEKVEEPETSGNDDEMLCKMLKDHDIESYYTELPQLDMYLTVDEDLLTGQGTNGSVFGGNHRVTEPAVARQKELEEILPIGTEKRESPDTEVVIKKARAIEDLDIVKRYLQSNDTSYEIFCSLMEVEKFLIDSHVAYK